MRQRIARGTEPPKGTTHASSGIINISSPKTPFYYRSLLLEGKRTLVTVILKRSPGEIPMVASLYSDKNSVVMLRASEAIKSATR